MVGKGSYRGIELVGVAVIIVSLFLPFGNMPVFQSLSRNLVTGGYYWSDVNLLTFLASSIGTALAGIMLGAGLFFLMIKEGGQIMIIGGAAAIILIALSWERLFPLSLGYSFAFLAFGTVLCSVKTVMEQIDALRK